MYPFRGQCFSEQPLYFSVFEDDFHAPYYADYDSPTLSLEMTCQRKFTPTRTPINRMKSR